MRAHAVLKGERSVASCLPYSQQIDEHTVVTHEGDLTRPSRCRASLSRRSGTENSTA